MAFETQTLGAFLEARDAATELLQQEGAKTRAIHLEEALIMQAASHILADRESFFGQEVIRMVRGEAGPVHYGPVYTILNRFEDQYRITTSEFEDEISGRKSRRLYRPTEFGRVVFGLFFAGTRLTADHEAGYWWLQA